NSTRLNVKLLKTRMTIGSRDFDITRTPDRGFELVGSASNSSNSESKTSEDSDGDSKPSTDVLTLGKLFTL
ncbi:MAG TPA: hypothetical protein VGD31_11840, partial [Sphingobacteriaceae bacterium]